MFNRFNTPLFIRLLLITLLLMLVLNIVLIVASLFNETLSQTGFFVSGSVDIHFYLDDQVTEISGINWGDIEERKMNVEHRWMKINSESCWITYYSNNPSYIKYELFYESSPNIWSRWGNGAEIFFTVQWLYLKIRLTALAGCPEGLFSFNNNFETR